MQLPYHLLNDNHYSYKKRRQKWTIFFIAVLIAILTILLISERIEKNYPQKLSIISRLSVYLAEISKKSPKNITSSSQIPNQEVDIPQNESTQLNKASLPLNKTIQKVIKKSPGKTVHLNSSELYFPDENDEFPSEDSIEKCQMFDFKDSQLTIVPDEAQPVIPDPEAYVQRPPDRPLIPRNFNQKIEGVHYLEISPGVIVPHNFSGIPTKRVVQFGEHKINVTTFDSGYVTEHFIWLPPFDWKPPYGLTKEQMDLFFKQPENHWHFDDCRMWNIDVIWEVKRGVSILTESQSKCKNHNYTNNLNFCEWPKQIPENAKPQFNGDVFAFGGHYIEIFQHFIDNGITHLTSAAIALGLDRIKNVVLYTAGCGNTQNFIMNSMGYKKVIGCKSENSQVSAENLILAPSLRVLHPYYFEFLRNSVSKSIPQQSVDERIAKYKHLFETNDVTADTVDLKNKVIVLPRGRTGGNARVIYNINDLVSRLRDIHGASNVLIYESSNARIHSVTDLIFVFSRAKAVLGPHGGACYNHIWAEKDVDFIEMIPMTSSGKYPKQDYWNRLIPFAHLAFLSSVQLNNQKFWRYITMNVGINYNIDVNDFIEWSKQIPSLANSGDVGKVHINH